MKSFIVGLILGLLILPAGAYYYFASGHAPVATDAPPMPFEKMIAGMSLRKAIQRGAPKTVPVQADETNLMAGAYVYSMNCSVCHGQLGGQPSAEAKGMFPPPPQLLISDEMVTDDPPGNTFWKVKNGIRLTGMPSFRGVLSDEEMWQVSLLLAHADKLSPEVQNVLKPGSPSGGMKR
jgi:thiosulfate dehydrogenase